MAQPRLPVRSDLSAGAERLSVLAGLTAGLAYSTFASFVANALTPVSGRLVATDSLRITSGHYQEVLSLDGIIPVLIASLLIFVIVWSSTRVILEYWNREDWRRIDALDGNLVTGEPMLIPVLRPVVSE
jgi:hypothetical protein